MRWDLFGLAALTLVLVALGAIIFYVPESRVALVAALVALVGAVAQSFRGPVVRSRWVRKSDSFPAPPPKMTKAEANAETKPPAVFK